jgi:hypothetical protein
MNDLLAFDYARGYFHQEADIQFAVARHLYAALSNVDDHWFVGSEHTLSCGKKPDVLCYYLPDDYALFIKETDNREKYLVAVIKIKFFASPEADLAKLTAIQEDHECLVWSIFANHFDAQIHEDYAKQHNLYEKKANKWINVDSTNRGATILKCGQVSTMGKFAPFASRIQALRDIFWIHD